MGVYLGVNILLVFVTFDYVKLVTRDIVNVVGRQFVIIKGISWENTYIRNIIAAELAVVFMSRKLT